MSRPTPPTALAAVLCLILSMALLNPVAFAQHGIQDTPVSPAALTPEQWSADLDFLDETVRTHHNRPFHTLGEPEWSAALESLRTRLPELTESQITVELARLMASIRDGHTSIWLIPGFQGIHTVPVRLYDYEDGLFIQSAYESFAWAVGAQVLRIGDTETGEVMTRIGEVVSRDNPIWVRAIGILRLNMPEVLQALGIVESVEPLVYTVRTPDGTVRDLTFTRDDFQDNVHALHGPNAGLPADWVRISDASDNPTPLYRQRTDENYWFTFLDDSKSLYVQYNVVGNAPHETIADFSERVAAAIESEAAERLILDIRGNGGGDSFLNTPLVKVLMRSDRINQRGRLFTVIGRGTFSAAQHLVTDLERWTNTLFVGEPTGSSPNHYGDTHRFELPNSGVRGSVSLVYWLRTGRGDIRPWVAPLLVAPLTASDDRENRDPALDAVLSFDPDRPRVTTQLIEAYESGGLGSAREVLTGLRDEPAARYLSTEGAVNQLGYTLMGSNRVREAIEVFAWNVELHPDSYNVYDSLGEAYLEAREWPAARENYARSLELNPRNRNAARVLAEMDAHGGGSD